MVEEEYVKVSKKIYRAMIYPYDEQDATEKAAAEEEAAEAAVGTDPAS